MADYKTSRKVGKAHVLPTAPAFSFAGRHERPISERCRTSCCAVWPGRGQLMRLLKPMSKTQDVPNTCPHGAPPNSPMHMPQHIQTVPCTFPCPHPSEVPVHSPMPSHQTLMSHHTPQSQPTAPCENTHSALPLEVEMRRNRGRVQSCKRVHSPVPETCQYHPTRRPAPRTHNWRKAPGSRGACRGAPRH
jgi:hypothetical protein